MKPVVVKQTTFVAPAPSKTQREIEEQALVDSASNFNVYFMKGPFERYDEAAATLAEAYAAAKRLNTAHGQYGRRACIYALIDHRAWTRTYAIKQQEPPGGWESID